MVIIYILKLEKDKIATVLVFSKLKRDQNVGEEKILAVADLFGFRERISNFSLDFWEIRPSEVFGARRKAALRGEAYAWAPVLGVFDKLREVGVSSYLGFTLCLSVFTMFELNEAVRGRLIGSKAWNRGGKF